MFKAKISSHIFLFGILTLLVIFSQFILLKPIIGQGLTNEDYVGFFKVRLYKDQMFSDPIKTWRAIGLHDATHDFYIGFLNKFFGEDYTMYLYTSIFIKIIATLLLYPLIFIITKSKLLGFLGSFLFGLSYPSTGALYLYVVGNEYLGVALMNLFLIVYYLCIKKPSYLLITLLSLIILLCFLASPIRIFPIFILVLLIEAYILIKNKFSKFYLPVIRIIAIFLPVILVTVLSAANSGSGSYDLSGWPDFLKKITNGNWFLLLNPLWGLGYTFLPAAYLNFLVPINISTIFTFLLSLFLGPLIKLGIVSLILSFLISVKKLRFFLTLMLINLIFDIVVFILYTHHLGIPPALVREYSGPSFVAGLYSGILAAFIFSIAISCGIEWVLTGKKNLLLFFAFISPFISLFFILGQWFFTRDYYMYQEGIHRYFVIPAIGSCLFIASILVIIYQRRSVYFRIPALLLITFILFQFFNISRAEISQLFNGKKGSGRELKVQQSMQEQTMNYIPRDRLNEDVFVYIKFKSDKFEDANQWEDTFDWRDLTYWMSIKKSYLTNKIIDGCVVLTWDLSVLKKIATIQNGVKGFLYKNEGAQEMRCFHNATGYTLDGKFVNLDNFYAFAIDGPKVINITDEVKKKLVFGN